MASSGTWPPALPQSLPVSTRVKGGGNLVVTQMAGPRKTRPRFTAVPTFLEPPPGLYILDGFQVSILLAFHDTDMGHGALSFDWDTPVPAKPGVQEVRFVQRPIVTSRTTGPIIYYEINVAYELLP